jgi:hypothetical protein
MRLQLHPERRLLSIKAKGSELLRDESEYLFSELALALGLHGMAANVRNQRQRGAPSVACCC